MERSFRFVEGEYYHIFNRGIDRRDIFRDAHDWRRFHELLYLSNSNKPLVFKLLPSTPFEWDRGKPVTNILAYALMPNHFHLVCREHTEGGITKMLSKAATSYSMYFNTKYERSGALLCRPFKAKHIADDEYLRWALSYVHLNPVKEMPAREGAVFLKSYAYTSYPDYYFEERPASKILAKEALPFDPREIETLDSMLECTASFQGDPLE